MVILLPDGETIGQRVARCRRAKGLSQEVLAHLLGNSQSWLTKVERGERQFDRISLILEVARVLKVDATELTGRPDRPGIGPLHPRGPAGRDFCLLDYGGPDSGPVAFPALTQPPPVGPSERWPRRRRRTTVNLPAPVWDEIEAEARLAGVSVGELRRRLACVGLYFRRRVRDDQADVIFEHPNGDSERLLLDPDKL